MVRVFLDANVLFSAANHPSAIARLIQLLLQRRRAVTSDFAVEEARRNILLKRPAWAESLEHLVARMEIVPSTLFDLPVALADKERPILCAAIRSRCDYLATGDTRDFGHLFNQTIEGVTVIPLSRLAELLVEGEAG